MLGLIPLISIVFESGFHIKTLAGVGLLFGTGGMVIAGLWQGLALPLLLLGWHYKRKQRQLAGINEAKTIKYIFWLAVFVTALLFFIPILLSLTQGNEVAQSPPSSNPFLQ